MRKNKTCEFHGQIVCGCGARLARCKCPIVPTVQFPCVHKGTADELLEEMVMRAAASVEEHPARMIWACKRIAKDKHMKVDDVFKEIQSRLKERTGRQRFPGQALDFRKN